MRKKGFFSQFTKASRWIGLGLVLIMVGTITASAWTVGDLEPPAIAAVKAVQSATPLRRTTYVPNLQKVYIEASSVELDLGITVFAENGDIATGYPFEFDIYPKDHPEEVFHVVDEAMTGQVYIEDIEEGDYTIKLIATEGVAEMDPISITVQPKVVFTKVDVSDKIVTTADINVKEDDSKYGGGNTNGGAATPPPTSADTVEFVASSKKEETVTKEVPVLNAQGVQVVKYKPVLGANGCLLTAAGAETDFIPVLNGDYITGVQRLVSGSPTGGQDPPLPPDPPPAVPVYEDVTAQVLDAGGVPLTENGAYKYQFTAVPQVETKTEVVTTYYGWQTINNRTFYFDKNGKFVTGNQIIQGVSYFFSAEGVRGGSIGIDVSTWQDGIDWNRVKASGVDFVIIRLGFRGYSSGKMVLDNMYYSHINGAMAAGLKVGVYFFTQAINEAEAVEEASMCLQLVQGYHLAFPIFIDIEDAGSSSARTNSLNNEQRTKICIAFCETIRNGGYRAGIYANKYYFTSLLYTSQFSGSYVIWLAHYTTQTNYTGRYDIWQHTSVGKVDGVPGNVDMNISYLGY